MKAGTKKYFYTYEDIEEKDAGPAALLQEILQDEELPQVKHLVVGFWGECYEESPQPIIDGIVANKERFSHLKSLYIGDMDYEECEVSWIIQGDYSQLFAALPDLEGLTIKGATELKLGEGIVHNHLKKLEIICGGLDVSVIRQITQASLPTLESLLLYLGVEDYGLNAGTEDLLPLLQGDRFPQLKELGIMDSEMQDQLAELILNSDIINRIKILNLSYGTLSDKGGQLLLAHQEKLKNLEQLVISYHFMTAEMVQQLEKLPCQVQIDESQGADSDDQYPMLTE